MDECLDSILREKRGEVLRAASGRLKHPYLVPGGSYEQAWDWDSYFIAVALADWEPAWPYIRGTVENFFADMREDGRAPRWLHPSDSFWDSTCAGVGFTRDLAKPFLAQTALVYSQATGSSQWFQPYLEKERLFLDRWSADRGENGLHVWANGLESGGDNHPDVFGWPDMSVEGVDLAVFLIREHLAASLLAKSCGDFSLFQFFLGRARFLSHQMQEHLFSESEGKFRNRFRPTGRFIRIDTQTQFYPFCLGRFLDLPVDLSREILWRQLCDTQTFWSPHGVRSTSRRDPVFNNLNGSCPSNWQGPVWIVGNAIHLNSLIHVGLHEQAQELATHVQRLLLRDLLARQKMSECYHSETGEPLAENGFLSWNLLARQFTQDVMRGRGRLMLPDLESFSLG